MRSRIGRTTGSGSGHGWVVGVTTLLQGLVVAAIPGSGAAPPGKIFWAFFKAFPEQLRKALRVTDIVARGQGSVSDQ